MDDPTHHLCGRLRLRFSRLKNDPRQLTAVTASLRAVPGVIDIEASPFTGALLIDFDRGSADKPQFWDDIENLLAAHGLHHNPRPMARQARPGPPTVERARHVTG